MVSKIEGSGGESTRALLPAGSMAGPIQWRRTSPASHFKCYLVISAHQCCRNKTRVQPAIHGQDKTVFCVFVGDVNRIGDKSRLSATKNFETVLSSLEVRWGTENSVDFSQILLLPTRTRHDKSVSLVWTGHYCEMLALQTPHWLTCLLYTSPSPRD